MTEHHHELAPPSAFVTVLAWILIVLTGLSSLMLVFQNIMMADPEMQAIVNDIPQEMQGQPMMSFMFRHMAAIAAVSLLACLAMLACAIGLLRRRNWGRLGTMALLGLAIAYQLGQSVWTWMPSLTGDSRQPGHILLYALLLGSTILTAGVCALMVWVIHKLRTDAIRAEFVKPPVASP